MKYALPTLMSCLLLAACGGSDSGTSTTANAPATTPTPSEPPPMPDPDPELLACDQTPPNPLRNAYFGELHLHTVYSLDAVAAQLTPEGAYRFAMGEPVAAPPYDAAGNSLIPPYQIDRPLDFAAVTDHGEWLGERELCEDPSLDPLAYSSPECTVYRQDRELGFLLFGGGWAGFSQLVPFPNISFDEPFLLTDNEVHRPLFCGVTGEKCRGAARGPWLDVQLQAERFNQPGCFTAFNGYEYTMSPLSDNMHRNVIFSGDQVPQDPVSVYEAPDPSALWEQLDEACTGECEYLTIPHNSNLSNGRMFAGPEEDGYDIADKRRNEPLIEIFQVKGDSECAQVENGSPDDPLCDFEKLPATNFFEFFLGINPIPPAPAFQNYVRHGLKEGLLIEEAKGANPFQYGFIASTDSHFGLPGAVDEDNFVGHRDVPPVDGVKDDYFNNPGGLAVVWAEENTRASLFDAMQRKETYGTSGPRMQLRVFGGSTEQMPDNMCERGGQAFVETGYAAGVPMGGELHAGQGIPRFAVWATADTFPRENDRSVNVPLQRVQIVKGWVEKDANGQSLAREQVFDIATGNSDWSLDDDTCQVSGSGPQQLCAVWDDPQFQADQNALYYARVVEAPTCRWLTRQCMNAPADLDCSNNPQEEWAACCEIENGNAPSRIQERAWASPIWYKQ